MKQLSGVIFVLLLTSHVFTQDTLMSILNQQFPAYELKSDLAFIRNKAEFKRYGGDGLLYIGKERFYSLYDSIEKIIDEKGKMSRLAFYFLTAPLVRELQDAASYYSLAVDDVFDLHETDSLLFSAKIVLPFNIAVYQDTAFITGFNPDLNRCRITAIDEIPVNQIVADLFRHTSFSSDNYYTKHGSGYINLSNDALLLYVLYGWRDAVEIQYYPSGSKVISRLTVSLKEHRDKVFPWDPERRTEEMDWFSLEEESGFAVLRIKTLRNMETNLKAVNEVFRKINHLNPKGLIVDIADCSWSHDMFWVVLLSYLYKGNLWLYQYHDEAQNLGKYTKKRIKQRDYISGKYSDIDQGNRFFGDVYLVTGSSTANAAVRFADIMRYNKIVKRIYGEETFNRSTHYASSNHYILPVTKLKLRLSTVLNYALDKNQDKDGLLPDVEIKPTNSEEYWENKNNQLIIKRVIDHINSNDLNENTSH
jgi:hypothetical protein